MDKASLYETEGVGQLDRIYSSMPRGVKVCYLLIMRFIGEMFQVRATFTSGLHSLKVWLYLKGKLRFMAVKWRRNQTILIRSYKSISS